MKKLLMPATALSRKKVASTILGCALLMFIAAPAWGQTGDQGICNSALPVGSATGCGAVITVTAVNNSGQAIAFNVTIPNNNGNEAGNGNPYDGDDDVLIGILNNTTTPLSSIALNSTDTSNGGIFGFDVDGPCQYAEQVNGNPNDCFNNFPAGYVPTGYEGPDNTFTVNRGTTCGLGTCYTSGMVNFTTAIPPAGSNSCDAPCNSTWFALEGTPSSLVFVGPTMPVTTGTITLTPNGAPVSNVLVAIPTGSSLGTVASMNVIETPVDPATFNAGRFPPSCNPATTSGGVCKGTANTFSGGSIVPPAPYGNVSCVPINGACIDLLYQCFDVNGNNIGCTGIVPPKGSPINVTYQFASAQFKNLAVLIASDFQNDWANITTSLNPGDICTKPPCGTGGSSTGLNTEVVLADLGLPCQVLTYALSSSSANPGTTIKVTGSLNGCASQLTQYGEKTLLGALYANATFALTGPFPVGNPAVCTVQTVTSPTLPLIVPFNSKLPFTLPVTVPKNACAGSFEVTSTIISGTVTYVGSATLTVP
jgi:hypothetical protein